MPHLAGRAGVTSGRKGMDSLIPLSVNSCTNPADGYCRALPMKPRSAALVYFYCHYTEVMPIA